MPIFQVTPKELKPIITLMRARRVGAMVFEGLKRLRQPAAASEDIGVCAGTLDSTPRWVRMKLGDNGAPHPTAPARRKPSLRGSGYLGS